ncbi:MAG: gas vesicle protein GvpG [Cytophagales bacterium]|nr:MAG: gas vesicle protein GvpG [Cytophagales bacterium]
MFFARTLRNIAQIVYEKAEKELYDIAQIKTEMMQLQLSLDLQKITEEEYEQKEEALLERFKEAQRRQKEAEEETSEDNDE